MTTNGTRKAHRDAADVVRESAAAFLMEDYLGTLCKVAGPQARVGTRVCWHLVGELEGRWEMVLTRDEVAVRPATEPEDAYAAHVIWALSLKELRQYLKGEYSMAEALGDHRLQIVANRTDWIRLSRLFAAWSKVDLVAHWHDSETLTERFKEKQQQRNSRANQRRRVGVSLRSAGMTL